VVDKRKGQPKAKITPTGKEVRVGVDPDAYKKEPPVWRFRDFDWDGPWGHATCLHCVADLRKYIEKHLANFETMTWQEILNASGGKREGGGNNNHPISVEKLTSDAKKRLKEKGVFADTVFSLRLEQCIRLYGVREGNCLRLVFFDPHHCQKDGTAAYKW
jgi:hypothetical protein